MNKNNKIKEKLIQMQKFNILLEDKRIEKEMKERMIAEERLLKGKKKSWKIMYQKCVNYNTFKQRRTSSKYNSYRNEMTRFRRIDRNATFGEKIAIVKNK